MAANSVDSDRMAPPPDNSPVAEVTPAPPDGVSVTLWLRGSAPSVARERQNRIEARVAAFDDAGVPTAVEEWPDTVTDPSTDRQRAAVAAFDRFRAVAGMRGIRLDPFFECRSNPDGSRTIRFPVACLTIERDGELTGLYPCYVDGDHAAIEDGLDAVESGDPENLR
ncbi:HTH domain-containing protein [Haloglomus litoreum]|uniref:HTH domain-containing protein n=1 Tax=Haloglomus litoreum TaxID=3034026 RepID=UPI0023E7C647|nr:HTH domain-containing protein [Haloglomus sp. DT116]